MAIIWKQKQILGAYLFKFYNHLYDKDIITMGGYNVHLDIVAVKNYIDYTNKYAPEKLI